MSGSFPKHLTVMKNDDIFLKKLLSYPITIGYAPLPSEPDLSFLRLTPAIILPQSTANDPFTLGNELADQFVSDAVCLYIPGTAFDRHGTRHGRGNGWYDRFLATVPSEWLRIGVSFEQNFSSLPLGREAWDQPVDWVCVQKTSNGVDYYETNARQII